MKRKQNPDKKLPSLEEVKNNYVSYLLDMTGHNIEEAAKILDVPPASLERKAKE
jgi:hypothetical protein